MESKIILIDTDFAWECLSGNEEAVKLMLSGKYEILAISSITTAELIKGCGNKQKLAKLHKVISEFHILHPNSEISVRAIELISTYHLSHNIGINDSYIASTCLFYDIELATCNISDYQYIPKLRLVEHSVQPKRKGWNSFL